MSQLIENTMASRRWTMETAEPKPPTHRLHIRLMQVTTAVETSRNLELWDFGVLQQPATSWMQSDKRGLEA